MGLPDFEEYVSKYMDDRMNGYGRRYQDLQGMFGMGPQQPPPSTAPAAPGASMTDSILPVPQLGADAAQQQAGQAPDMSQPKKGGAAGQQMGASMVAMMFA